MPLSRPRPLGGDAELLSPEAKKMQQELPNLPEEPGFGHGRSDLAPRSQDDTMANAAMCYLSPLGQRSKALSRGAREFGPDCNKFSKEVRS
eukprot:s7526_g2.t1